MLDSLLRTLSARSDRSIDGSTPLVAESPIFADMILLLLYSRSTTTQDGAWFIAVHASISFDCP